MRCLAHISIDGREQTVKEHLKNTAEICSKFASKFGAEKQGYLAGLYHDLGKYSDEFQNRLLGGPKVDHSTAGMYESLKLNQIPAAFTVAGHHSGLPDGGSRGDLTGGTFYAKYNNANMGKIPEYSGWNSEITEPELSKLPDLNQEEAAFFIRMLYSCLVDADFIETESFMEGSIVERSVETDAEQLNMMLDKYTSAWYPPKNELNDVRCKILNESKECGESSKRGIFSLTVPTGGGKTISSLAFALRHLRENQMDRVIYVVPYTTIIEQTAEVFRDILGEENVLEHHSGVVLDISDEATPEAQKKARMIENWDAPVIVTTSVQFFESLFSNRPSKCRKLHNIANSIIVFDEAQMIPVKYIRPCVYSIAQLVKQCNSTAVLCTATQPALNEMFSEFIGENIEEICKKGYSEDKIFDRVKYSIMGNIQSDELASKISTHNQALCIVNSRKNARELYEILNGEGLFHLSTLMYPAHRKSVLSEIRTRLKEGKRCVVISTSLVEAGVDVDFPVVFREESGLDSIIQAGGRCNREGKRSVESSMVYVFKSENKIPPIFEISTAAAQIAIEKFDNRISEPDTIQEYFKTLLYLKGRSGQDIKGIMKLLEEEFFPFKSVAEKFKLIENDMKTIYIPVYECQNLIDSLIQGKRTRDLIRKLGRFCVNVYEDHYRKLLESGAVQVLDDGIIILSDSIKYDDKTGLSLEADSGQALFI